MNNKKTFLTDPAWRIYGIPFFCYVPLCILVLAAMFCGALPSNMPGTLLLLMILGGGLNCLGNHAPVIKSYLGGGTIACIFGAAFIAHFGLFPETTLGAIDSLLNQTGFIDLFISALITGSILSMERELLIKSALKFLPVAFLSMAFGIAAVVLTGLTVGYRPVDSVMFIAIPMMSGGMGAGVIPLSKMYAEAMGTESSVMISRLIPASTLGNIAAILMAALLFRLGEKVPSLSGNGRLVRTGAFSEKETGRREIDLASLSFGLLLSLLFYIGGNCLNRLFPVIHSYAWMIVLTGVFKASGLVSDRMSHSSHLWSQFVVKTWTSAILIGVGAALIDLNAVAGALTPSYLLLIAVITVAVAAGAAFGGYLVGFFPIESAITAGLCTINMGGSGNIAILSASRRMELLAFAQLATRICGSLVLVLTSILLRVLY